MLDFTALDFETANHFRGSPCAIGLVKVRDGQVIDEQRWMMRPPVGRDEFSPFNVALHGITPEMVADAPYWHDAVADALDYIEDDVVVAHNAGFDLGVVRYACAAEGIEWPAMDFLCSLVLARRHLSLPSYSLPFVAQACGVPIQNHHDALDDARAVAGVMSHLARVTATEDIHDLAIALGVRVGRMEAGLYRGSHVKGSGSSALAASGSNPDADPQGYLFGRVVVFTGALMSMTRQEAWDQVSNVGGTPDKSPTKRTNVLVLGDQNPAVLRPGATVSKKAQRAFELQDKGQDIELMTEADFLTVLDGANPLQGDLAALLDERAPTTPLRRAEEPGKGPRLIQEVRPLTRQARPTDQLCHEPGCESVAAFGTNKRPTWCTRHIDEMFAIGGLIPLEEFTHPSSHRLTRCTTCGCEAHYRFEYVQNKNGMGEPTCRACYWKKWASDVHDLQGEYADLEPVPEGRARAFAEEHGYQYLGPLTSPSLAAHPHRVKCVVCGLISAERLSDIGFGCLCQAGARKRDGQGRGSRRWRR